MSRCSKKCNELCEKIQSISGLSDDFIYGKLLRLEHYIDEAVIAINKYEKQGKYNGIEKNAKKVFKQLLGDEK